MSGTRASARPSRVLRGLGAAGLATFVATVLHVAAGGDAPSSATLGLTLAFSTFACVALAGRRPGAWRTALSVVVSQVLYHLLFSLDPGTALTRPLPLGHTHTAMAGMDLPTSVTGSVDAPMWGAHLTAAILTIAGLLAGEWILASLARLPRGLRAWFCRLLPVLLPHRDRLSIAPAARPAFSRAEEPALRALTRRGPPALSF